MSDDVWRGLVPTVAEKLRYGTTPFGPAPDAAQWVTRVVEAREHLDRIPGLHPDLVADLTKEFASALLLEGRATDLEGLAAEGLTKRIADAFVSMPVEHAATAREALAPIADGIILSKHLAASGLQPWPAIDPSTVYLVTRLPEGSEVLSTRAAAEAETWWSAMQALDIPTTVERSVDLVPTDPSLVERITAMARDTQHFLFGGPAVREDFHSVDQVMAAFPGRELIGSLSKLESGTDFQAAALADTLAGQISTAMSAMVDRKVSAEDVAGLRPMLDGLDPSRIGVAEREGLGHVAEALAAMADSLGRTVGDDRIAEGARQAAAAWLDVAQATGFASATPEELAGVVPTPDPGQASTDGADSLLDLLTGMEKGVRALGEAVGPAIDKLVQGVDELALKALIQADALVTPVGTSLQGMYETAASLPGPQASAERIGPFAEARPQDPPFGGNAGQAGKAAGMVAAGLIASAGDLGPSLQRAMELFEGSLKAEGLEPGPLLSVVQEATGLTRPGTAAKYAAAQAGRRKSPERVALQIAAAAVPSAFDDLVSRRISDRDIRRDGRLALAGEVAKATLREAVLRFGAEEVPKRSLLPEPVPGIKTDGVDPWSEAFTVSASSGVANRCADVVGGTEAAKAAIAFGIAAWRGAALAPEMSQGTANEALHSTRQAAGFGAAASALSGSPLPRSAPSLRGLVARVPASRGPDITPG